MSEELTPITRIEEYLDGIVNGGAIPLEPVTRVEQFLDAIANSQTCALTPVTRIEQYLGKISGQSLTLPDPVTRVEMYLAAIAGEDVIVPDEPVTRIEMYLDAWANGGGSPEYDTATGSVASFVTLRAAPLKELVVDINPVQSGSGDPSPDNVRPISGWTGAQIWVDDTHDTSAQADYNISWQSEAGTVYGGTLTIKEDGSWVLTRTALLSTILNGSGWTRVQVGGNYYFCKSHNAWALANEIVACSHFKPIPTAGTLGNNPDCSIQLAIDRYYQINIRYDAITTAEAFTTYMASAGAQLVYTSSAPTSFNLTPGQVAALLGQNYLWADTGDVSVTYYYPGTTASPIVGVGTVNNMVI